MPSLSDTRPHKVRGALARDVEKIRPSMCSNHDTFAESGNDWATPYVHDAEPKKLSTPVVMRRYFTDADTQRFLDADMQRRRNLAQNAMACKQYLLKSGKNHGQ